ncbi:MAG: SDR family NAD(P)-dependent oxidoreductase [Atopobiaceae bacterium]
MGHLDGKVAIVTGSGQGIGRGIARFLAQEGARVVTNNRHPLDRAKLAQQYADLPADERQKVMSMRGDAASVAQEIRDAGGEATPFFGDVSDFDTAGRLVQTALDAYGRVDILVNNAAGLGQGTIANTTPESWDYQTRAKMTGAYNTMHHVVPHMMRQGSGTILNSASNAWVGIGNLCAYSAGNAGLVGLTKAAAQELSRYGITVNAYCPRATSPGHVVEFAKTVRTLSAALGEGHLDQKKLAAVEAEHADPIYLAPFLAYLCCDDCRDVTGQVFGLSASGKIEWYSQPAIECQVQKGDGHWTVDELAKRMPDTILRAARTSSSDAWEKDGTPRTLFPLGVEVPAERFHGKSYVNMIQGLDDPSGSSVGTVTFAPGAHNDWHTHHGRQVLMVTDGEGVYQERGKAARLLHKGDVVTVEPGVEHWHGATPGSWFSHVGMILGSTKATDAGDVLQRDDYLAACRQAQEGQQD